MAKRKMSEASARQRVNAQPHQEEKIGVADVVIKNSGSFEATWKQVVSSWERTFPQGERAPVAVVEPIRGELHVERGRPRQAAEIAAFITRLSHGKRNLTRSDVMAAFGEKAFLLLRQDEKLVGLVGWQVENLIARVDDIYIEINQPFPKSAALLMGEVERASRELQCEVALVFVPQSLALKAPVWRALKYEERLVSSLGVRAWQEAALESMRPGTVMLFKQLRRDRVLKPV
jgi:dephospho-CoA kinase